MALINYNSYIIMYVINYVFTDHSNYYLFLGLDWRRKVVDAGTFYGLHEPQLGRQTWAGGATSKPVSNVSQLVIR